MSQMVTTVIASLDPPSNIKYHIFTIKYSIFTIFFCQYGHTVIIGLLHVKKS